MSTVQRAKHIQKHMGGEIYYDRHYQCFRVMKSDSLALVRFPNHYIPVRT